MKEKLYHLIYPIKIKILNAIAKYMAIKKAKRFNSSKRD